MSAPSDEDEQTLRRARRGTLWSPGPDTRAIAPGALPPADLNAERFERLDDAALLAAALARLDDLPDDPQDGA